MFVNRKIIWGNFIIVNLIADGKRFDGILGRANYTHQRATSVVLAAAIRSAEGGRFTMAAVERDAVESEADSRMGRTGGSDIGRRARSAFTRCALREKIVRLRKNQDRREQNGENPHCLSHDKLLFISASNRTLSLSESPFFPVHLKRRKTDFPLS